jgi:hypothetical protein
MKFIANLVFGLLLVAAWLTPWATNAQIGLDQLVIMAGTTTVDAQGRDWAYLAWQATDPASTRGRRFAIYAKAGDANAAASYARQAIVGLQTDPLVIEPLLQRSIHLGQDLGYLNETINSLFEKLTPDPALPLAQRLSAVIRGSLDHPDHFKNLVLMSRVHPAVGLCLGWAHAGLISGPAGAPTTFELRAYDPATDRDLGVVGRATVRARQPVVLPAPGAPVEVPNTTPQGDLNVRFRWATPDNLRRASMLQHGFNIYRVPRTIAQQQGWNVAPPTPAALRQLVQSHPLVHQLNHVPILNPRDWTEAEAHDFLADDETFFYADWNDRFNPTATLPQSDFVNGAQFYYFLTARDLLGRDGLVSPGTLMTVCDRMPPRAPSRVRVVNHYDYQAAVPQRLQVIWNQNEATSNDTTTAYFIYRWSGLPEMHIESGNPANNLVAGPIAHVKGSPTNSYLDNGFGAPGPANTGATFWYTVVAIDAGACAPGANRSPHSAPAFGVIRDRVGPDNGGGRLEITCTEPHATFRRVDPDIAIPGLSTNARHYRLSAERNRPAIAWAEFAYEITGITTQQVFLARQIFAPGASVASLDFALPTAGLPPSASPRFLCRVGALNGRVSDFAVTSTVGPTPNGFIRPVLFDGTIESHRTTPGGDCFVHDPHGDDDGSIDEICAIAALTPGTKEVKFYRRVDNGPLTLVCQREADPAAGLPEVRCCDGAMPAQPADLCYYVQLFDEHGNAGAMVRLGCVKTAPNAPLPTPILSPITAVGSSTDPRMHLQWFCAPYGVERFEVWVTGNPLPPATLLSPVLTLTNSIEIAVPLPGVWPAQPRLLTYLTRRVGPSFGNGALFGTDAKVILGNNYAIFVRAVGHDGSVGPASNVEQFRWHEPSAGPTTQVPWPARPLPAVSLTNFPGVQARMFHTNDDIFGPFPQQRFEGVGLRVGAVTMPAYPLNFTNAVSGQTDPIEHVYRSSRDLGSLFPLAVYRTQVPNAIFPEVSANVVQVTPLMEQIAFHRTKAPAGSGSVLVDDPFIRLIPTEPTPGARNWELYLLDTQPVVEEAAYQYFLVRLHPETREISEVMPTNPVHIIP